ncbi:MAG TPA: 2-oxo-4-hydroxy-4-carboxy-5-ureidoimidazoline decarboxylase [Burkholderiales bacterium]|nr:2-oxo-4-hydroxy-4-carboxy-5-ureidoimidazoline decarboxylase [Burkholderiales bacterium]
MELAAVLAAVNALGEREFVERFGGVFEHSPWVARRAWQKKPFGSLDALHAAMMQAVAEAKREEQLALVRAHPELAGKEAKQGALTVDSSSEQGRLGFLQLTRDEVEAMQRLNRRYRERHGFPCIVALRLHSTRASVVTEMERRALNDSSSELKAALEQIGHITRGRLEKIVNG